MLSFDSPPINQTVISCQLRDEADPPANMI